MTRNRFGGPFPIVPAFFIAVALLLGNLSFAVADSRTTTASAAGSCDDSHAGQVAFSWSGTSRTVALTDSIGNLLAYQDVSGQSAHTYTLPNIGAGTYIWFVIPGGSGSVTVPDCSAQSPVVSSSTPPAPVGTDSTSSLPLIGPGSYACLIAGGSYCADASSASSSSPAPQPPPPQPAASQSASSAAVCPAFSRTLSMGNTGDDVTALQQFLIAQNFLPAGDATGYFGELTQTAVQQFQAAQGVVSSGDPASTGFGVVGRRTQNAIQNQCTATSAPAARRVPPTSHVPLVGVNYNVYNACTGPATNGSGLQNIWILQDYQKTGVQDTVRTQLKAMDTDGVEAMATLVNFFAGAAQDHQTDGAVNISNPTEVAAYLSSMDQFLNDVKAAGIQQMTLRFNAVGANSPLDYARASTVASGASTPPFDSKYVDSNFAFIARVRAIAEKYQSANFNVLFDLQVEGDTAVQSSDAAAASYVQQIWQKYYDAYGGSDASFDAIVRDGGNGGFGALLGAYQKSGRPFPKIQMFQFYNDQNTSDSSAGLLQIGKLLDQFAVPSDSREIQIVEGYYDQPATAASIWHLNNEKGFEISEQLVWPLRLEDKVANACSQIVPPPYHVDIEKAIAQNGPNLHTSGISSAGYYAPDMNLWIKFWGASGTVPLLASTYDNSGALLRTAVPVTWVTTNPPTIDLPISTYEHQLLATQPLKLQLWQSDGSASAQYSITPCGADYASCGGIQGASASIADAGYYGPNNAVWIKVTNTASATPVEIDVYDSDNHLLRSIPQASFGVSPGNPPVISFTAAGIEQNDVNWRLQGGFVNLRLRVKMSDGSFTQLFQILY